MTTITWVLDVNSKYEISSKDHLVQLMNSGLLYTNAGTSPSDFFNSDYIQTIDIDLDNDVNIVPLGNATDKFTGSYDGGNFTISNWSYTDPEFLTTTDCANYNGFFGETSAAEIKNIRLGGVFTLNGFRIGGGMLVGNCSNSVVANIEANFSTGTTITQGDVTFSWAYIGGLFGVIASGSAFGVSLYGEMTIVQSPSTTSPVLGGVVGFPSSTTITLFRNMAIFPSGLSGYYVGGVAGYLFRSSGSLLLNAMEGNLSSPTQYAGGVVGVARVDTDSSFVVSGLVNSMKGDISGISAGGVIGFLWQSSTTTNTYESFINYMGGDISGNGILGFSDATVVLSTSINAMSGSVNNTIGGNANTILSTVNTNFGLTFTTDDYGTSDAVVGLPLDSNYDNLPYVELSGTDSFGVVYAWDFVYNNQKSLQLTVRPISAILTIDPVDGATGYKVTVRKSSETTARTVVIGFNGTDVDIMSLSPDTEYVVGLYSTSDDISYVLELESTITTSSNSSSNYDIGDFDADGEYDISSSSSDIYDVINELFTTGDLLVVTLPSGKKTDAKFIKRGETSSIVGQDAVFIGFDPNSGTSQTVTLTLSDNTTSTISYDETTEQIIFGGQTYSDGEYFILDGKKMIFTNI